jgi:HD-GYP domain-containing protein (c-di-GMP phosphodiesterase class II)
MEQRLGSSNFLQMAREIALCHHERWDGSGYPAGLRGDEIPLAARIVAIADSYDAMSAGRSYRRSVSHDRCIADIRREAGKQFDPALVEVLLTVEGRFAEIAKRCKTRADVGATCSEGDDSSKTQTTEETYALVEST